jgi:hypothetical protein
VSPADWRALIEAYLDGRLSAEAFMRRFVDGWRTSGGAAPRAIVALQSIVEAFEAELWTPAKRARSATMNSGKRLNARLQILAKSRQWRRTPSTAHARAKICAAFKCRCAGVPGLAV